MDLAERVADALVDIGRAQVVLRRWNVIRLTQELEDLTHELPQAYALVPTRGRAAETRVEDLLHRWREARRQLLGMGLLEDPTTHP